MATAVLAPRHVFGFRPDVADNVGYNEDGAVVYPAGHNIVLYSQDAKAQRLIPGTLESEGITAMCISANRKLLAVAERSEKAIITVYDLQTLKRRKVLTASDTGSKEYVSLAFSADGKMLLAQGGAPEWNMLLWVWEKSKVATMIKTTNQQGLPVHSCSFSPGEGSMLGVVGQCIFKMFKYTDGSLKPLSPALGKRDPNTIISQCWVPSDGAELRERMLVGTADGEVLLLDNGTDLKAAFSADNGLAIHSLVCYSKGFVAGQENGVITIFEKDDKEVYRRARSFTIENNAVNVKHMSVSPNEEQLVCSLANGQLYTLLLSNNEIMKADEMNFDILGCNNHQGPITGLDICVRKPLIATASTDKSVRLWNYNDHSCELVKWFADEIFSIAIHPTGLQVLVGFADKLRLMTVLMEDLRTVKELGIKGCRECCFSNGGQYFAAVNGTTISIYNTYTCENVGNLRGHNGKVRSLYWSPDDTRLISAGMDGAVYEWRLKDLKRDKENVLKGCNYSSVLATPDCKTLYAAGSDRKIKEFEEAAGAGTQVTKEVDAGVAISQLALINSVKAMIAATDGGNIRTYKYPLTGEFVEMKAHQGSITRLRVSWDESLVVSASDDGSVAVWDIKDRDAKAAARREQERLDWAPEVLVTRSELDEKRSRMQELEQQVAELTMQAEYQLKLKEMQMAEKIKELTEKFSADLEADRQKYESLVAEKNEGELEAEEKLKAVEERAQAALAALDGQYQAKIMTEVERYQVLSAEKDALAERWDEQNALLVESHERVIAELTEDYEAKLAEEALKIEQLQGDKAELEREFEEIKRQLEEDADREIEELKEKYEQKLQGEKEATLRLKGENGIMRKKFNALQKDIEAQKEEIKNLFEQKRELYATIASLEKDIASLKREIRERDETIGDKERRIYDLKKKNQELEKFKFVLDYKIKELKKHIEPREKEIADMKEQIKEMDGELERYHKTNSGLDLTISNLRLKQSGLQGEVLSQRQAKSDVEVVLKRLQHDLTTVVAVIQEPKSLKERVKNLYHKYCSDSAQGGVEASADVEREAARQREYLEKTVDSLKRKLAKDSELHRTDNLRIMQENTALIKEINELRREIRSLKTSRGAGNATSGPVAGMINANNSGSQIGAYGMVKPGSAGTGGVIPGIEIDGLRKELEIQRDLISRLREDNNQKEDKIRSIESMIVNMRPGSRERTLLPPMTDPVTGMPPIAERSEGYTSEHVVSSGGGASFKRPSPAAQDDEAAEDADRDGVTSLNGMAAGAARPVSQPLSRPGTNASSRPSSQPPIVSHMFRNDSRGKRASGTLDPVGGEGSKPSSSSQIPATDDAAESTSAATATGIEDGSNVGADDTTIHVSTEEGSAAAIGEGSIPRSSSSKKQSESNVTTQEAALPEAEAFDEPQEQVATSEAEAAWGEYQRASEQEGDAISESQAANIGYEEGVIMDQTAAPGAEDGGEVQQDVQHQQDLGGSSQPDA